MNNWFTSDLHLFHSNIMKYNPDTRPYSNVDEMNMAIMNDWILKVHPDDTIYILGDVSFGKPKDTVKIISSLPGKKILIEGNHDHRLLEDIDFINCFHEIHDYLFTKIEGKRVAMFHYPIAHWNRMHHGAYHLHGHLHAAPSNVSGRILDVGWDNNFKILNFKEIIEILEPKEIRTHGDGVD